ncbi:DNA-directed RNA polymerases IV and V subunit 4-like isoform X2 [Euphorbia lathyris]|uniref:DNA-directed RNA polymerases IV and V subunit 4-like isoform X1 n=1 Tax=Euphorbia lathyris TaxID=212925 RepID=UPI003313E9AA
MDKGGKGFSLPVSKGNNDSSAKSKRGRKVQFSAEGLPNDKSDFLSKSDGKFDSAKGSMNKGGKGDKTSNGGKANLPKEPPPLELRIEQELPKTAVCMMDCEAAQILQGIHEQMVLLSQDPKIKLPVSFDRALQYANTGAYYTNPQSIRKILESLKRHGVSDGEISVIAKVCPDNVDEVFALVPSLKSKRSILSEPLNDVISQIAKLKK